MCKCLQMLMLLCCFFGIKRFRITGFLTTTPFPPQFHGIIIFRIICCFTQVETETKYQELISFVCGPLIYCVHRNPPPTFNLKQIVEENKIVDFDLFQFL